MATKYATRSALVNTLKAEEADVEIAFHVMQAVEQRKGWQQVNCSDNAVLQNLSPETLEFFNDVEQVDDSMIIDQDRRITVRLVLNVNPFSLK